MTVERKLKSLKTHFMSVHKAYAKRRLKADLTSGSVVKPKWFAYEALTFLIKGRAPRVNREASNVEKVRRVFVYTKLQSRLQRRAIRAVVA